jgi:hypothetical protein
MASDHRVGGEEVMSKKQVILKDYVQWLSKRTKPVRTSRQVASIKLEAPEEESGKDAVVVYNLCLSCDPFMRGGMQKDLPPGKQPHVLSSSQRWNCTDLLICKVPKNLDLFSKN